MCIRDSGSHADRDAGEEILEGLHGRNLAGRTSLAETAAVIDRSALLVSGDSGLLHMAVGLGKPTVSLFGPGSVAKWAPRGPGHIVLTKNLPCSPCTRFGYTPRCPRGAECLQSITVEEVAEAVFKLLESRPEKEKPRRKAIGNEQYKAN
jgi:ADP-heptose:LPS heptosyltransferase